MNQLPPYELFLYCCVNMLPELTLMLMACNNFLRFSKKVTFILSIGTLICYFICTVTYSYGIMSYITANIILNITYILFGIFLTRGRPGQLLFALFIILNYGSVCSITAAGLFHIMDYPGNPFGWQTSLCTLAIAVFFWALYYWLLVKQLRPLFTRSGSENTWNTIWLVPALFCIIHYFCIWTQKGHFADNILNVIFLMILNLGSAFVSCLVAYIIDVRTEALRLEIENQQLEMSRSQYENILTRMEETRHAQHDFRQHLRLISSYLDTGNETALRDYISQYAQTVPQNIVKKYCENRVADAVLRYYDEFSPEFGTTFLSSAEIPKNIGISDPDLCVLLGNILENALESCKKHPEGKAYIHFAARQTNSHTLTIVVDNYPADRPDYAKAEKNIHSSDNSQFLSSKHKGTGIGTTSIRKIAQKYGGSASFEWKDDIFTASVILAINSEIN